MISEPVPAKKTQRELNAEWDLLAPIRHRQIITAEDRTYHNVLVPSVLALSAQFLHGARVLDIGCGTGELTRHLATIAAHAVGVDPSRESVAIARSVQGESRPEYYENTIQDFSALANRQFDVAIANMTLMDCLDLGEVLAALATLLKPEAPFIFTITHPWNWSIYWGYHHAPWFNYKAEISIEASFRISTELTHCVATHIHRPLEAYVNSLQANGFFLETLIEPLPDSASSSGSWPYPRYLAARAIFKAAAKR